MLYWTDRGNPPLDNTVNRAPMDEEEAGSGDSAYPFAEGNWYLSRSQREMDVPN